MPKWCEESESRIVLELANNRNVRIIYLGIDGFRITQKVELKGKAARFMEP